MKRMMHMALAILFFLGFSSLHAENPWLTNFETAKSTASAQGKNILVLFTGSDWCPWCVKLEKEVFATEKFQRYAQQNLILVKIDFPRSKPLSPEQQSYNESLASRYGVQGLPTVLIFNAQGDKLLETGYTPGGPDAFISHLPGGKNEEKSGDAKNGRSTQIATAGGLILLLLSIGYFILRSTRQTTALDLPDPTKYSAEFLGGAEEFTADKDFIHVSGNRFSLAGASYDPEKMILTLKSGSPVKFVPKK